MFGQIREEYKRHGSRVLNPPLWALWNHRFGRLVQKIKWKPLAYLSSKIYGFNRFMIMITSGIQIPREVTIGKDFHIIHSGNIIIHPDVIIGDRCGILNGVTIGSNMKQGTPIIGNDVFIGAGAKVLGSIVIGDGARIAANSLVTCDVPPSATAIGVPAVIVRSRDDKKVERLDSVTA